MKKLFIDQVYKYDGTQLKSLYAYLTYKLLGDSIVSWVGPCEVNFDHMVDGEDLLDQSEIRGDLMLHFIIEIFDRSLFATVAVQRLMAALVKDLIESKTNDKLTRKGDDIYFQDQKLSISIAASSPVSTMVHFAVNVKNSGTPVKTCALEKWKISEKEFAEEIMELVVQEIEDMKSATFKVKPLD